MTDFLIFVLKKRNCFEESSITPEHYPVILFVCLFVLFCFVLFCFVLFCFCFVFVLFCFVLFCFVLFCFVLFFQKRIQNL